MKSDLVDIEVHCRRETPDAYALWDGTIDEHGREVWVWVSKSLVERDGDMFTMPEWLALREGLI